MPPDKMQPNFYETKSNHLNPTSPVGGDDKIAQQIPDGHKLKRKKKS